MITKEKATYADYQALPEGAPYQLIDGELVMAPSPTRYHQIVSGELEFALRQFVKQHAVGEVYDAPFNVYFSETEAYQPDIVFVSNARRAILTDAGAEGAPDLIVEVLSPSTGYAPNESEEVLLECYDLTHKKHVYAASGVREYWIADPQEKYVEVHVNRNGVFERVSLVQESGEAVSEVLEGFSVSLDTLFTW